MTATDYDYLYDYKLRLTELQDIAAMDRLAAELTPPSTLRRWAEQRRYVRGGRPSRIRRLIGGLRTHHA